MTAHGALVIGPDHLDSFASNIAAGLSSLGLNARVVDPRPSTAFYRAGADLPLILRAATEVVKRQDRIQQLFDHHIERLLSDHSPSLVISVWSDFTPGQIERFKKATPHATWIFWYPDHVANLGAHRLLLAPYDHYFFKEPHLVERLAKFTDVAVHMLADACNPNHHRTVEPDDDDEKNRYSADVVIAGNLYPYRLKVIEALPESINLKIFGNARRALPRGFERFNSVRTGEFVAGRTKALAFGTAKIVLNTMHYAELGGVNVRLFEATGSGGFVLTQNGLGIANYFAPGGEVAVFDSASELTEAVWHYLSADDERARIAKAGQSRAHRDHTYPRRLTEMLGVAGCSNLASRPAE